jgi:hypothetical protein
MAERPSPAEVLIQDESGFTLIELIVAVTLSIVVLTATLTLFESLQRNSAGVITRAASVQSAQVGLREMDSELQQAYQVEFPTTTSSSLVSTTTASSGSGTVSCTAASGVEPCNVVDVLVRLSGTPYEVRYDCSVASATVSGARACWRYTCPATVSTGSAQSCTATTANVVKQLLIDNVTDGTSSSPVFSFCYPGTGTTQCSSSTTIYRPTSASVVIDTPAAGTLATANTGADRSTVQLTDEVYMANLGFGQ